MLNPLTNLQQQSAQAVRQSYLTDLRERERAQMEEYIRFREYDEGIHYSQLTERLRAFLDVAYDRDFTVNYCPLVLDAFADRLNVTGLECDDTAQEETLWDWWRANRMDRRQNIVHRAAARDGDTYVSVDWDNERGIPRFTHEQAFAGDGCVVYYSDEYRDRIAFASKNWRVTHGGNAGKQRRLNLYFPDRIEKYVSNDDRYLGDWRPYISEDDPPDMVGDGHIGTTAIYWWTDTRTENGKPLGVPIVHFKNKDKGDRYGTSRLQDVLPLQDALNKTLIDLLASADVNGFPLLVGYGDAGWADVSVGPGAIAATSASPDKSRLEKIPAESPDGLLRTFDRLEQTIGRITGTPLSYFQVTGQMASAESQKQHDAVLVAQVEKAQTDFGDSWEQVMGMARRLQNAFGEGPPMDLDATISAVWKPAVIRDEKSQAETLQIKVDSLGVSKEQAQTEMGYDATQRANFLRERLRDKALQTRAQVMQVVRPTDNDTQAMDATQEQTTDETDGNTENL